MPNVIIPKQYRLRSEQERVMKGEWGTTSLSGEQLDKLKFIEKRYGKGFYKQKDIESIK